MFCLRDKVLGQEVLHRKIRQIKDLTTDLPIVGKEYIIHQHSYNISEGLKLFKTNSCEQKNSFLNLYIQF